MPPVLYHLNKNLQSQAVYDFKRQHVSLSVKSNCIVAFNLSSTYWKATMLQALYYFIIFLIFTIAVVNSLIPSLKNEKVNL